MASAVATVGRSDSLLFGTLAFAAQRCIADFAAQELTNTAWAFATAGRPNIPLFAALASVAEDCVDDFTT